MAENFKSAVHVLNKKDNQGCVSTCIKNPATHKGSEGPQTTHCQTQHPPGPPGLNKENSS